MVIFVTVNIVFFKFASILLCFAFLFFYISWNLGSHERDLRSEVCKREDTTWLQLLKQEPQPQARVWIPLLWIRLRRPRERLGMYRFGDCVVPQLKEES